MMTDGQYVIINTYIDKEKTGNRRREMWKQWEIRISFGSVWFTPRRVDSQELTQVMDVSYKAFTMNTITNTHTLSPYTIMILYIL